jgi:stress-induced morphogen
VKPEDIVERIRVTLPDAQVELKDLTGTQDHWHATVISAAFTGKSLIERHRMVMTALALEMKGPIHALSLDVKAPHEA